MKAFLNAQDIADNIKNLQAFMKELKIDAFLISSNDEFLNEYTPLDDNHRYYFSGFTGSTAEMIIPKEGKALLYVDGRYHEQVDNEIPLDCVEAVKVPMGSSNHKAMFETLKDLKCQHISLEGTRQPLSYVLKLQEDFYVTSFNQGELEGIINFQNEDKFKKIYLLDDETAGRSVEDKLQHLFSGNSKCAFYVNALDNIAWLTNCRGYHFASQSSYKAKALVLPKKVLVFVHPDCPVSEEAKNHPLLKFVHCSTTDLEKELKQVAIKSKISKLKFDPQYLPYSDYEMLQKVFKSHLIASPGEIFSHQSIKSEGEVEQFRSSFKHSDQAIKNSIKWVRAQLRESKTVSEYEFYEKVGECYENEGALDQSFHTIAATGANGSIIHYGNPKPDVKIKQNDLVLVDSGGYYESGFATDCTRTFIADPDVEPTSKQKEIYTLVLKGMLKTQMALFKEGTSGAVLDGLARAAMYRKGYDFNHGTGHGVGVHVHEPGVRISPASNLPMRPGQVVSIEPGIYIPGFGGVRLENVAVVQPHPEYEGFLYFEPLVYLGFDHKLIEWDWLSPAEKTYLDEYEKECERRGTLY